MESYIEFADGEKKKYPNTTTKLDISFAAAAVKIVGFPYLKTLNCSHNQLTELPQLDNLHTLDCSRNQLTELPQLDNLHTLDCRYNQLTELPKLDNLHTLDCRYNQLTELPKLDNLHTLYCSLNQLTELPQLDNLHTLNCSHNQLTELPKLDNLHTLDCSHNPNLKKMTKIDGYQLLKEIAPDILNYEKFDMNYWGELVEDVNHCGTPMCIAGYLVNSSDELKELAKAKGISFAATASMPHHSHIFYTENDEAKEFLEELINN